MERAVPFDCFEKGSGVGGNWRDMNDTGTSSAYRLLWWPDFPGELGARSCARTTYRTPDGCEDRNVLVAGFGNSAVDIACEISRVARMTCLAVSRAARVPKYLLGRPPHASALQR